MAKSKAKRALDFVRRLAAKCDTATDLHNAFFGNGGEFGKLFPTRSERKAFMQTPEYEEILELRETVENSRKRASA